MQIQATRQLSGRPSATEAGERLDKAEQMFMRGVTSGAAIGRALGVSQQAGSDLMKRVRQRLGEQAIRANDEFQADKQAAIARAEDVLASAWRDYSNATALKDRNACLQTILTVLRHLSDINGVTVGAKITVTAFLQQNNYTLSSEHEAIMAKLGLTPEDFTDERYSDTFQRLVKYYAHELDSPNP